MISKRWIAVYTLTQPWRETISTSVYEITPFQKHLAEAEQPFHRMLHSSLDASLKPRSRLPAPTQAQPNRRKQMATASGKDCGYSWNWASKVPETDRSKNNAGPICPSCFPHPAQQREQGPQDSLPTHCLHPLTASWLVGRVHSNWTLESHSPMQRDEQTHQALGGKVKSRAWE